MQESMKSKYSNKVLDRIFCYFMRTILHLQNSGIEKLPIKNDFEEPVKSYMDIGVNLLIDGQPPEIACLILDAEYDAILCKSVASVEILMSLRLIKDGISIMIKIFMDICCPQKIYGEIRSLNMLQGHFIRIFQKK